MAEIAKATPQPKTKKKRRFTPAKLIILILVLALVFAVGFVFAHVERNERILPNVSVAGIELGGFTLEEAALELEREFGESLNYKEVTFVCDDVSLTKSGAELGIAVHFEQSALAALQIGRQGNIFTRTHQYISARFSPQNIPLVVSTHDDTVERVILELTRGREVAPLLPTFEVQQGRLTIQRGTPGYIIDRALAREMIEQTFGLNASENITLNIEHVEAAMFTVDELYQLLTAEPADAYFGRDEDNNIVVIPEQIQVRISRAELADALAATGDTIQLQVEAIYPSVTTEALESHLFRDVLASYTTFFNAAEIARSSNVRLSASRFDGFEMMPGEEFSFDELVGPRTAAYGFQPANIFVGNRVEVGFGGGICQPSSTVYVAALYADLKITERHNHSLPVGYVRGGLDATIVRGVLDLRFVNNTDYPIRIVSTSTNNSITVQILGTQTVENKSVRLHNVTTGSRAPRVVTEFSADIPAGTRQVSQRGQNGFTVRSYRIVTVDGVEVRNEFLHTSVYQPMDRIYEVNPADANRDWDAQPPSPYYNYTNYTGTGDGLPQQPEPDNQYNTNGGTPYVPYVPTPPEPPYIPAPDVSVPPDWFSELPN